jgi:DNA repair photolyase
MFYCSRRYVIVISGHISFYGVRMHFTNARSILSPQNGMNIFRGCLHGCIYCDSRSRCYHIDHDFEDIEVKENAPVLLEDALRRKRRKCMIGTGSMSDPYIPVELVLGHTRKCLEIIEKYGFGLSILTKSDLISRDLELLKKINAKAKCVVQMTLTTYDESLCRILEPAVCTTKKRFETLKAMRDNGIPTVVWFDPILPFINDTEENLRGILAYCVEADVRRIICFGMGLTLRDGNREYFYKKLDEHFPGVKAKYQKKYGYAYEIISDKNEFLMGIFRQECDKHGIIYDNGRIFQYLHEFEDKQSVKQMSLFGDAI